MNKIVYILIIGILFASCNNNSDTKSKVKTIDSLDAEVERALNYCLTVDTSWVLPITKEAAENYAKLKSVYTPDSIIPDEAKLIGFYKEFKKVGNKFYRDKDALIRNLRLAKKQLKDLKTDVENAALTEEEVQKYLNQEKLVTIDLLSQFKLFKDLSDNVVKKYDSVQPLIVKLIEVYSQIPEEKRNVVKNR